MTRRLVMLALLSLALPGCDGCTDVPTTPAPTETESSPTPIHGGGTVTPTPVPPTDAPPTDGPTATPGGNSTPTATEPVVTQAPTPTPEPPTEPPTQPDPDPITSLVVYPEQSTLPVGGTLPLRVVGVTREGNQEEVTIDLWNSSDPSVASVDAAGVVTGLVAGTTLITATGEGLTSAYVTLNVVEADLLKVSVIDAANSASLADARIYVGDAQVGVTDAYGKLEVTGEFSGPLTVTAIKDGYHYATVAQISTRDVRIPLRLRQEPSKFTGSVDFTEMSKENDLKASELRIGLVTRSIKENPLALDFATLIGPIEVVDLCGIDIPLPTNFVGETAVCDIAITEYEVPGPPGEYAAYALVGDLPASSTLEILDDPEFYYNLGDFMQAIGGELDDFSYAVEEGVVLVETTPTEGVDLSPAGEMSSSVVADLPPLPDGVDAETPPLLFVVVDMGEQGYLPIGLAGGDGLVQIYHPPLEGALSDRPVSVIAMAARGGVGSTGPYSAIMAAQSEAGGILALPEYLRLVEIGTHSLSAREFPFYPIPGVVQYRSVFSFFYDNSGKDMPELEWDVWQNSDGVPPPAEEPTPDGATVTPTPEGTPAPPAIPDWVVKLPNIPGGPKLSKFDWEITAYDCPTGTFEGFAGPSGVHLVESGQQLVRMSRNQRYNIK